jgi:hypothetical protein
MSKLDELKGEVDWLGRWLNVSIITDFALIGWTALNYETQKDVLIYSSIVAIFGLSIAILMINRSAMKKIRSMKDLKK